MRNLVNTLELNQYLRDQFPGLELGELMVQALSLPLRKEISISRRVTVMPHDPEPWLTPEIFRSRVFFHFEKELLEAQPRLMDAIELVRDWIGVSDLEDEPWLEERSSKGVVLRLQRIGTVSQAVRLAEKDLHRISRELDVTPSSLSRLLTDVQGETREVVLLANGWRWVQLLDERAIRYEGRQMRNCLKAQEYVDALPPEDALYSLRNTSNVPLLTARYTGSVLKECRGRNNQPPSAYWTLYILALRDRLREEYSWHSAWKSQLSLHVHPLTIKAIPH